MQAPVQHVHPQHQQMPPGGPQQYPPPKKKSSCLTGALIGCGVLVVMGMVLLPLAIYGVTRYLASAKTAEAKNAVGAITRGAVAAYEREGLGQDGELSSRKLCASATPVPSEVPSGRKYVSTDAEWGGTVDAGWRCLKFSYASMPSYYQYHYNAGGGYVASNSTATAGDEGFEAAAKGDLDGDTQVSLFARTGKVEGGTLKTTTMMYIENELE